MGEPSTIYEFCIARAAHGEGVDLRDWILVQYPTLTLEGIFENCPLRLGLQSKWFRRVRAQMTTLDVLQQFHFALEFLRHCPQRKTINRRVASGHMKHVAEQWWAKQHRKGVYISRGAFILAALASGIRIQRIPDSFDVRLSLKTACRNGNALLQEGAAP